MPSLITEISEICTALGMLGLSDLSYALDARSPLLLNVGDEEWSDLADAFRSGLHPKLFKLAYANGVALLTDEFGLRERRPHRIEWKGPHRTPGYELMPIDLRIDHVFLVSCKYESHLLFNSSPWHLFDRLLAIRHGSESGDWFLHIAGDAYERLYRQTVDALGVPGLPDEVSRLDRSSRDRMRSGLVGRWPDGVVAMYREFAEEVSRSSARWWGDRLPTLGAREEMLWRMLRISSAPYLFSANLVTCRCAFGYTPRGTGAANSHSRNCR